MLRTMVPLRRRFPATLSRMENEMERFWDPLDRFFNEEDWDLVPQKVYPIINLVETEDMFEVTAELPGMTVDDVKVEFQDGVLWILGEKKEEKEDKGRTFLRYERAYGKFNRRVVFPAPVKDKDIVAEFENGILKVVVPKSEELKPKHIKVKAN